ncbi:MAG: winged helix-turn-helix transcriptional regulator [Ktedonobacteraceae bacterium]|nr:winged helix-turn-helix transcriptional regulator [Ktedonobacteraceae bacterium]
MHNPPERLVALEALVTSLEARITAIEEQLAASGGAGARASAMQASPSPNESSSSTGTIQGKFSVVGSLLVGEQPYNMRVQEQVHSFFDAHPEQVAQVIAAVGNPHRVTLLRTLYQGPRTALQLQEELAMGSVGQLYHHLKELVATGLVIQSRRSTYSIAPAKMMWISLLFMVAFHLMPPAHGDFSVTPSSNQEHDAADTT